MKETLQTSFTVPSYSRLILPLAALLEGSFFTEYIKKGDILMLSEGRPGLDNVYMLKAGVLSLYLDKETYERSGLTGRPDGAKGARGTRARWVVDIDLRQPSMLHGKKGFDRILYAFKNVLNTSVTWLFIDLSDESRNIDVGNCSSANLWLAPSPDPLEQHCPTRVQCPAKATPGPRVLRPSFNPPSGDSSDGEDAFAEYAADLYEWLSLISLESPRVDVNDTIDPFLARYRPPAPDDPKQDTQVLVKVVWEGFFSGAWAHHAFVQAVLQAKTKSWFSYAAFGFRGSPPADSRDCTVLKIPGPLSEYIFWEIEQD
jgi:ribonuclease P/MRP protein subunit RPP40